MYEEMKKPCHEQLAETLIERLRQGMAPCNLQAQVHTLNSHIEPRLQAKQPMHEQHMHDWTGLVQIKGAVERDGAVQWAEDAGVQPDFYRLYAQKKDDTLQWLSDYRTERQAQDMADRLAEVFSMMSREDFQRLVT
jgi:hypothetical protein